MRHGYQPNSSGERGEPPHQGSAAAPAKGWTCAARKQGTAGGNDPTDCDWPTCGCDPYATKVIDALQEAGLLRVDTVSIAEKK